MPTPPNPQDSSGLWGKISEAGQKAGDWIKTKGKEAGQKASENAKQKASELGEKAKQKASETAKNAIQGKKNKDQQNPAEKEEQQATNETKTQKNQAEQPTNQNQTEQKTTSSPKNSSNKPRLAINGFGRIGRQFLRIALLRDSLPFEIVAINNPGDPETITHLFEFDSTYGRFPGEVKLEGDTLKVKDQTIKILSEKYPGALPWKDLNIDIVIESTGIFRTREKITPHLNAGAKKVILSAPAKSDDIPTVVLGVNDDQINFQNFDILSNASCTTNCIAPVIKVLDQSYQIKKGNMCTIHSYTNDQNILDQNHKDLRRARAAALSIIPTTTGAAKAVGLVYPKVKGKINGYAIRIPTPTVSLAELVIETEKPTTTQQHNQPLKHASENELKNILALEDRPLVSVDYRGNSHSSIIDTALTEVDENFIRVVAWYDNEWGYTERLVDIAATSATT